jgi:hypothetical protein
MTEDRVDHITGYDKDGKVVGHAELSRGGWCVWRSDRPEGMGISSEATVRTFLRQHGAVVFTERTACSQLK